MNLLIEEVDHGRVDVTTDSSSMDVAHALLLLELARLNILSAYLGGEINEEAENEDENQ